LNEIEVVVFMYKIHYRQVEDHSQSPPLMGQLSFWRHPKEDQSNPN